uniref:hypothetical protein n=1 Tax=Collinsella aerofaciens TaxID=74426 RepID=UPI001E357879
FLQVTSAHADTILPERSTVTAFISKLSCALFTTDSILVGDTECYCGVRYFQSLQFIEPYRARSAIIPPNEKANCAA